MTKPQNYDDFLSTTHNGGPVISWPEGLKAMWHDANGNWEASHDIAQEMHNDLGSWIHAYLHRKEGDKFNAGYWYTKAKKPFPKLGLDGEHRQIVEFIIGGA